MFPLKEEENIPNKNFYKLIRQTFYSYGGAFAGLDKLIDSRGKGSSIGFGAKVKNYKEQPLSEIMKMLEPEDLIKYGLIPEFIGRMPIIATLDDLDEKSLVKILKEPKNSLIKQYQRLFEFEEVELEFKEDAILEIARKAISKKQGKRFKIYS